MFPLTTIVAVSLALMCQTVAGQTSRQESLPLANAIKAFNKKAAEDPIGKDQPPLTEEEAIAAIRAWEHTKSKWPMSDEMYEAFKKVAETRTLPPNASFYWETGYQPVGAFVFDIWSVRIGMSRPDRSAYDIELRSRFIRSRTLEEELDQVQKKLQQFLEDERERDLKNEPLLVGGGHVKRHLEQIIESLKARIAKQKATDAGELAAPKIQILSGERTTAADVRFFSFSCEASNPNKVPLMFVGYRADSFDPPIAEGHISPIYSIHFQRDGKWEKHPIGWCGTGMDGIEFQAGTTKKFGLAVPVDLAGKVVRVGIRWSRPLKFDTAEPDAFKVAWSESFAVEKVK